VLVFMLVAGICLFMCYRKNVSRHRGYENVWTKKRFQKNISQ
jgi:hypothetical protein